MSVNSDFKDLLNLFNAYRVKYLIIGGYAVIKYTELDVPTSCIKIISSL
jgi:hypothetical protein